jgi:hypothetical protein
MSADTQGDRMTLIEHRTDAEVLGDELRRLADEAQEWARRAAAEVGNREMMRRERDETRQQLGGAVAANDDAFQVICDALSALHPPQARELMETPSYKAFAAFYKRGQ